MSYRVQRRDADGVWETVGTFGGLTDALESRDVRTSRIPDHKRSWVAYRVADNDGHVLEYRTEEVL